ncbi:CCHC-type domain-containing protein [Aphis craccivora]|uniref:CCHC-type domain-containing protein n=1 Tax=Aphis craccivora TaxID=307492 RepID=A0A6G0X991_APHCR|nr:CCHC-type domain-containing protein [Aphis craccivora]
MAVQAAPNTKLEIKTAVRTIGAEFRDFADLAKQLGMTRNPDAVVASTRQLQQQQVQQHTLTLKLLNEIREEQLRQKSPTDTREPQITTVTEARHESASNRNGTTTTGDEATPSPWIEVAKRKRKILHKTTMPDDMPGNVETIVQGSSTLHRKVRTRPPALLVEVKADELPALARKIRGGVDREIIGDSIIGMRQAKSGGLLIEVRGDQGRFDAVRSEISRSAGPEVRLNLT